MPFIGHCSMATEFLLKSITTSMSVRKSNQLIIGKAISWCNMNDRVNSPSAEIHMTDYDTKHLLKSQYEYKFILM